MLRGAAKRVVVDVGIVLQGESEEELPEVLLGVIRMRNVDFSALMEPLEFC